MKKLILVATLAAITFGAQAQGEISIGLKGAYNYTGLFNKNVSDQGSELDYAPSFGGTFGFLIDYRLSENYSVESSLLISGYNQKYDLEENYVSPFGTATFGTEVIDKLNYLDIPVLFKLGKGKGAYIEAGPQFSFLLSAKESYTSARPGAISYSGVNCKKDFKGIGISGILGFGADINLNEQLGLTTGIRLGYTFTDGTTEYNKTELLSNVSKNALFNHTNKSGDFVYYKSIRAWAGLNIGLTYKLEKK